MAEPAAEPRRRRSYTPAKMRGMRSAGLSGLRDGRSRADDPPRRSPAWSTGAASEPRKPTIADLGRHKREASAAGAADAGALENYRRVHMPRRRLARWCGLPRFQEAVVGFYVRACTGRDGGTGEPTYRLCRIEGVATKERYSLPESAGGVGTDRHLTLSFGRQLCTVRIAQVSDKRPTADDVADLVRQLRADGMEGAVLTAGEAVGLRNRQDGLVGPSAGGSPDPSDGTRNSPSSGEAKASTSVRARAALRLAVASAVRHPNGEVDPALLEGAVERGVPRQTVLSLARAGRVREQRSRQRKRRRDAADGRRGRGKRVKSERVKSELVKSEGAKSEKSEPNGGGDEDGKEAVEEEADEMTYAPYRPSKLRYGAAHPDPVVENATLAAVDPPDVRYNLAMPADIIAEGRLSDLQVRFPFLCVCVLLFKPRNLFALC